MIWDDDRRVYLAGQRVGPGRYRRVEPADGRTFEIERADTLPASLDGRVAVYVRIDEPATASPAVRRERARRLVALD
jgi:hypothetical protein